MRCVCLSFFSLKVWRFSLRCMEKNRLKFFKNQTHLRRRRRRRRWRRRRRRTEERGRRRRRLVCYCWCFCCFLRFFPTRRFTFRRLLMVRFLFKFPREEENRNKFRLRHEDEEERETEPTLALDLISISFGDVVLLPLLYWLYGFNAFRFDIV